MSDLVMNRVTIAESHLAILILSAVLHKIISYTLREIRILRICVNSVACNITMAIAKMIVIVAHLPYQISQN